MLRRLASSLRPPALVSPTRSWCSAAEGSQQAVAKPAAPEVAQRPALTFHVVRTVTGELPVYSKISNGRTRKSTVLRKYTGDVEALRQARPTGLRQMLLENVGSEFDIAMYHGRMEVKGHHVKLIKGWLEKLGF